MVISFSVRRTERLKRADVYNEGLIAGKEEVKMNSKVIAKQIINFNKANFDNTFDAITVLQNHSEKMVDLFLEQATLFPPEGKKVIAEWMESFRKGRKDFKVSVDDNFKTVEDFFVSSVNAMDFPVCNFMEKANAYSEDAPAEIKKESVDRSDKALNQTVVKKETGSKGKTGVGIIKKVRRTAKAVKK